MDIKTITSTEGVNEVDFGSGASRFYWFQNIGTTTVHVAGKADITAGADGVAELAAGGVTCIETLGGKVYVLGAGVVQIHNTGDKFCPVFKRAPAQSGGGSGTGDGYTKSESDARYAQKSEIPTALPANGGNADTADAVNGIIILNAENISTSNINDYVKWACTKNTVPKTTGFVYAGIWFKNNLSYTVTAQIIAYATKKAPVIQAGYGTGSFQSMFGSGSGREWFANTTLETTAVPIRMTVPAGKTGYFGFNNTGEGQYAIIDDVNVFTLKSVRFM